MDATDTRMLRRSENLWQRKKEKHYLRSTFAGNDNSGFLEGDSGLGQKTTIDSRVRTDGYVRLAKNNTLEKRVCARGDSTSDGPHNVLGL